MKSAYLKGSVSASLGVISVDWVPTTIELPEEVASTGFADSLVSHGPMQLTTPSNCRFMGPPCYIENAPFETALEKLPSSLQVAVPFDITYRIKNKTSQDQTLKVHLDESEPATDGSHGFLVSGLINGDISIGPFETYTLSYTALATRTGKMRVPQVRVSSERFRTWVIQESSITRRSLFIMP